MTMVYKDLGSFTFHFKDAKCLLEVSSWQVKYENRSFRPNLKFHNNRLLVDGTGIDEEDQTIVSVKIDLRPESLTEWDAYYETEDEMAKILIEGLEFD